MKGKPSAPVCPTCGKTAELVPAATVYKAAAMQKGQVWLCAEHNAHAKHNEKTGRPNGPLMTPGHRLWRTKAHLALVPLCQVKVERDGCTPEEARQAAYGWLAPELMLDVDDCRISKLSEADCRRVVAMCNALRVAR